jgi:PRTRC genetic system ThiF family protein
MIKLFKKRQKKAIHFLDRSIAQTVHPIVVNVIGTGGTGSQVLRSLADMNQALIGLGHSGILVRAFDDDTVSEHNRGRQPFATAEVGSSKAIALINRINRFYGTNWLAVLLAYRTDNLEELTPYLSAQITISCVDTVRSRFEIEGILKTHLSNSFSGGTPPSYWMDYGNDRHTGQVFLSTLREINQPDSKKYLTIPTLPLFTEEYRITLQSMIDISTPSCSTREALQRQDLFINPALALLGCRLLWTLITDGMISHRGLFLNLSDYRIVPIPVNLVSMPMQSTATPLSGAAA